MCALHPPSYQVGWSALRRSAQRRQRHFLIVANDDPGVLAGVRVERLAKARFELLAKLLCLGVVVGDCHLDELADVGMLATRTAERPIPVLAIFARSDHDAEAAIAGAGSMTHQPCGLSDLEQAEAFHLEAALDDTFDVQQFGFG